MAKLHINTDPDLSARILADSQVAADCGLVDELTTMIKQRDASSGDIRSILQTIERHLVSEGAMPKLTWLYCFRCGMSHYHKYQGMDTWLCPNCHAVRTVDKGQLLKGSINDARGQVEEEGQSKT